MPKPACGLAPKSAFGLTQHVHAAAPGLGKIEDRAGLLVLRPAPPDPGSF